MTSTLEFLLRTVNAPEISRTATLPDGRSLSASRAGPTAEWFVRIGDDASRVVSDRWLLAALIELLELPRGDRPDWLFELTRELSGYDTPLGRRYPCPCCDYLTLPQPPTGTHWICSVCAWEDDRAQYCDLDYTGGANKVSLRQARAHYRGEGISEPGTRVRVRPPLPEEYPPDVSVE